MVLVLSMLWRKTFLSKVGRKEDTALGNTVKQYATKIQGSIATHALIRTRSFIIIMGFPGLVHRQGFASWNINIPCHNFSVDCCVCLPSILYFSCWTCFVLVFLLFRWSLPIIYHMSDLVDYLIFYCFCWMFECRQWKSC